MLTTPFPFRAIHHTISIDMPYVDDDDSDEEALDDRELPDPADHNDIDDEPDTQLCPHCGKEIFEDAEQCPKCGNYLTHRPGSIARKPIWLIIAVIVCVLIVLEWIFHNRL